MKLTTIKHKYILHQVTINNANPNHVTASAGMMLVRIYYVEYVNYLLIYYKCFTKAYHSSHLIITKSKLTNFIV